jgi:hypothetical protein
MHSQWRIAGDKNQDKKDSENEDEVVASSVEIGNDKEKAKYVNPDKDKTCNHCKKKGHTKRKCWKNIQN